MNLFKIRIMTVATGNIFKKFANILALVINLKLVVDALDQVNVTANLVNYPVLTTKKHPI